MPAWRRHALALEPLGDGVRTMPGEAVFEYSLDDGSGGGAGFETVKPLAVNGLGRVGVGTGIHEPVAIGRPPSEETPFDGGLAAHGRPHPSLDPYVCGRGRMLYGTERACQSLGGRLLEHRVLGEVFAVLEQAALAATPKALDEAEAAHAQHLVAFERTV